MMYSNKFIAVVKANGKILRETGQNKDEILIPFGQEYELYFKNLNSQRAVIKIDIDGRDILDGNTIVINANSEMTLKRFLTKKSNSKGPRFKFIEKTSKISENRNDKIDDGLIRIEFWFERKKPDMVWTTTWPSSNTIIQYYGNNTRTISPTDFCSVSNDNQYFEMSENNYRSSSTITCSSDNIANAFMSSTNLESQNIKSSVNDLGITVKGKEVVQKFENVYVGPLENTSEVMIFHLRGIMNNNQVNKAVDVKRIIKCDNCGTKNKSCNKFCSNCGNNLNW